jgi:hypothetical protein
MRGSERLLREKSRNGWKLKTRRITTLPTWLASRERNFFDSYQHSNHHLCTTVIPTNSSSEYYQSTPARGITA